MLIFGTKLTAEQRLQQATSKIMAHRGKYEAFTGLLMFGEVRVSDYTPTAYTDGLNETYGRKFVDDHSDAVIRFTRLHECMHKAYRHMLIYQHLWAEDPDCINRAADYVINLKLKDLDAGEGFLEFPDWILCDEKYRGMDAAQVYRLLRQEKQQQQQQQQQGGGQSGGDKPTSESECPGGGGRVLDDHGWEEAKSMTTEEARELSRAIDDALRQGAIYASRHGTGGKRAVHDLLEAQVKWEDALRDFLTEQTAGRDYSTWRRFNRRAIAQDMYLPGGATDDMGELVVAVDTSGSIHGAFLSQFLGEIKGICETLHPEKLRVLYWDTTVCQAEVYTVDQLDEFARSTRPAGGGGTDPTCVVEYLKEHRIKAQATVVLTDGYFYGQGSWPGPVLWCVVNNKSFCPTHGQIVHITL